MLAAVRQGLEGALQEAAVDMTRLGQRLAGKPLVPRAVPFLSADVVQPQPDPTATVDPSAVLTGQIFIRRASAIGPNVVIRGATGVVDIGKQARIGSGSVLLANTRNKENPFLRSCIVGHEVTVGERVVLANCRVDDKAVIGDDCRIGEGAIVESGAVLEKGTVVPAGRLVPRETRWGGNPAKYLGPVESGHH